MENDIDLVTRLRWFVTNIHSDGAVVPAMKRLALECATEIERLRENLKTCQEVRDSWCAAYTELRDNPQNPSH